MLDRVGKESTRAGLRFILTLFQVSLQHILKLINKYLVKLDNCLDFNFVLLNAI